MQACRARSRCGRCAPGSRLEAVRDGRLRDSVLRHAWSCSRNARGCLSPAIPGQGDGGGPGHVSGHVRCHATHRWCSQRGDVAGSGDGAGARAASRTGRGGANLGGIRDGRAARGAQVGKPIGPGGRGGIAPLRSIAAKEAQRGPWGRRWTPVLRNASPGERGAHCAREAQCREQLAVPVLKGATLPRSILRSGVRRWTSSRRSRSILLRQRSPCVWLGWWPSLGRVDPGSYRNS